MSFINYLKERWITYLLIAFIFFFSVIVYMLDHSFSIRESNALYILSGWVILVSIFSASDYYIFNYRIKKIRNYCQLNRQSENIDEFYYPSDREYAKIVHELAMEYEKYKAEINTKASDEMDFITKWLHNVKVPISATKLILENQEENLPKNFYQNIYSEIFTIEESIQKVFYELKSNRFYDDYKITQVSTKKIISQALKGYSNFFSYKKLSIHMSGDDYEVLTDEKWSVYIVSQIISNAVKYTFYEGIIEINTKNDGLETTISVKNTGLGILDNK